MRSSLAFRMYDHSLIINFNLFSAAADGHDQPSKIKMVPFQKG